MAYFNCTILIDDDPITNYINNKIVTKLKLSPLIKTAFNGIEGLEMIKENCLTDNGIPELILLDLNMPVMNGFEFLEAFQKIECPDKKKIIIIVLTTSSHSTDISIVKKYNVSGYLNKPLSLEKLSNLMHTLIPDFV